MKRAKGQVSEMGFSIVELLITLAVIAIVIAIVLWLITPT